MSRINRTDLAWAAGFMDGEAWIGKSGTKPWQVTGVEVFQTRVAPLKKLQSLFGGSITPYANPSKLQKRRAWRWRLYGKAADAMLEKLNPYFMVKQRG